ncbi:MAG TPA: hypothetical protein VLI06_14440, partial [Solimonas sp.]|nr:hypothetical protein [Solimonas sp.]
MESPSSDLKDLEVLVETRTPLIFAETSDPAQVEQLFRRLATRSGRPLYRWTLATGLAGLDPPAQLQARSVPEVLGHILRSNEPALYLLMDLGRYLEDALTLSQLREIGQRHGSVPHTLVLVGSNMNPPAELRAVSARFDLSMPELAEIETLIHEEGEAWGRGRGQRVQATQVAIKALARNLAGLPRADVRRLVRNAIVDDGVLAESDLPAVMEAKYKLLDQGGVLSFELKTVKIEEVAGLARLKTWLAQRKDIFLSDTPPPGFDPPKGLLLLGVQGGGKSLASKSVA